MLKLVPEKRTSMLCFNISAVPFVTAVVPVVHSQSKLNVICIAPFIM